MIFLVQPHNALGGREDQFLDLDLPHRLQDVVRPDDVRFDDSLEVSPCFRLRGEVDDRVLAVECRADRFVVRDVRDVRLVVRVVAPIEEREILVVRSVEVFQDSLPGLPVRSGNEDVFLGEFPEGRARFRLDQRQTV